MQNATTARRRILGLIIPVALPLSVGFFQSSLGAPLSHKEWIFFYPTVFFCAWFGGFWPGLLSTVISISMADYFFIPPLHSFHIEGRHAWISVGAFAFMSTAMSLIVGRFRHEKEVIKKAQELAKSRSFLDSLLENIPNMVFVKDAKELRFVRFNKAGEELLGYGRQDLIGKNDYDFFTQEQADFFVENDRRVLRGRQVVDIPEESIQTRLHGTRILHTKKIPLFGVDGEPEYLLGISEDITEKKQNEAEILRMTAEEAVLQERERNTRKSAFFGEASTILASSLDYHQTLSELARLTIPFLGDWCTVAMLSEKGEYRRVTAVHQDPSRKENLNELLRDYAVIQASSTTSLLIHRGQSLFYPTVSDEDIRQGAQDQRHFELIKELGCHSCMVVPISCRGKVLGAMAFVSASTQRTFTKEDLELAQEVGRRAGVAIDNSLLYASTQAAVRARDEFLSIASHELKTPITSLKLQFQMTKRSLGPEAEGLSRMLGLATKQIDRITALIEGLLDVSRIQSGRLTINRERVELNELISGVIERFQQQLNESNCSMKIKMEEEVHGLWDRMRIEQIILNLISNAAKYAPGSQIDVNVEKQHDLVNVSIRDYGPGIPPEKHAKIFERFERGSHLNEISGLGLGLYIVKQIVDAHGGNTYIDREITKGTQVVIQLPLEPK